MSKKRAKRGKRGAVVPTDGSKDGSGERAGSEGGRDADGDDAGEIGEARIAFDGMSSEEKCDMIAELSEEVMEDPTKAFSLERKKVQTDAGETVMQLPSKMQKLLDLGRTHKNGNDDYVACLAIMSLLALFKDIIPSYRIRPLTDVERATRVSKETKQLWDYERGLLTHYQQFLQLIEKACKSLTTNTRQPTQVEVTAMLTACELAKCAYHFNFRSNIITMVVRQMNHRHCEQISDACCEAVAHIFEHDSQGEVALETSRMVAKLVREYRGTVRDSVIRTFSRLPLRVHIDEAIAAKLATSANKKKRRRDRELTEIEEELQEGSASVDKIMLARCQSETLQTVVLTYFRILKSHQTDAKRDMLPAALDGLAKFAHLINIDTVIDLLEILKSLLADVDKLPLQASLGCILTAFRTLQGPGKEMNIDIKEYITPLYTQLPRLATETNSRASTDTVVECLTAAFLKRREFSMTRVAAFVKQLFAVSMHTPASTSVALTALARHMLQKYPGVHQMFDNEQDVITAGEQRPDVYDPEQSNPFGSSAWAVSTLRFHLDPAVSGQAAAASELKMLQMPGEDPQRLLREGQRNEDELYIRFRRNAKRHPLVTKSRSQLRFVTPRKRKLTLLSADE